MSTCFRAFRIWCEGERCRVSVARCPSMSSVDGRNCAMGDVEKHGEVRRVVDGGARAWLVMLGSFFCNGILFGVINSYGVLYTSIHQDLVDAGDTSASSKAGEVSNNCLSLLNTCFIHYHYLITVLFRE